LGSERVPLKRVVAVGGGAIRRGGAGGMAPMALLLARGTIPERLRILDVQEDGTDATPRIVEFVRSCGAAVDALMARSVPIAGFNYIDARAVLEECGVPSVFVLGEEPDMAAVGRALMGHFPDWEARLRAIEGAGPVHAVRLWGGDGEEGRMLIECVGIGVRDAVALAMGFTVFGRVPEPVRVALMAARAVGEVA